MSTNIVKINDVTLGAAPVTLPAPQVQNLLATGEFLVNEQNQSGTMAGINYLPTGAICVTQGGQYRIYSSSASRKAAAAADDKRTIRTAQFVCGITGLLMINIIVLYDVAGRGSNVKDFLINFASDITALGAVLVIAEMVDRRVASSAAAPPAVGVGGDSSGGTVMSSRRTPRVEEDEEGATLFLQPVTSIS